MGLLRTLEKLILLNTNPSQLATLSVARRELLKILAKHIFLKKNRSQHATLLAARKVPLRILARLTFSNNTTNSLPSKPIWSPPHNALPSDATPRPPPHTSQLLMTNGQETMVFQTSESIEIFSPPSNTPKTWRANTENGPHSSTRRRPRSTQ